MAPGSPPARGDGGDDGGEVAALRRRVATLEARLLAAGGAAATDARSPPPGWSEGGPAAPVVAGERTTLVIFGADGNLATTKTFPTLFALWRKRLLPRTVAVVGYARAAMDGDAFRRRVYRAIYSSAHAQAERTAFLARCSYVSGQFDAVADFRDRLAPALAAVEASQPGEGGGPRVRVYYMAVPPFLYARVCRCLRDAGLRGGGAGGGGAAATTTDRFVLEKPFGRDGVSCRALCDELAAVVAEDEAFRIDHYLGKELVMNVLVLRFANLCFAAIWSRQHVRRVTICCHETQGTFGRGGYFDAYGIIRDVMQNHLAQILALVAMDQPLTLGAADMRREKVKALRAAVPPTLDDVVVGQYDGYSDDPSVADARSTTETFAAVRLFLASPRWAGVPFLLSAGKALRERKVEVRITFRDVPGRLADLGAATPNELVIRVQPDECIYWRVMNRVPGLQEPLEIEARRMNLLYTPTESRGMPDAYERLLLEVLRGDATNFVGVDELDAAWAIFSPALAALAARRDRPARYAFGSDGPDVSRLLDDGDSDARPPPARAASPTACAR